MKKIAFYAGSFDPLTNGHLDVIKRGLLVIDEIIIGIGVHPGKKPLFTFDERQDLIRQTITNDTRLDESRIKVISFDGLAVEAAKNNGATFLLRGLRDSSDLDDEMRMAGMNEVMEPDIKTVFFPASADVRFINATLVRQIAKMKGDISAFVPKAVHNALLNIDFSSK